MANSTNRTGAAKRSFIVKFIWNPTGFSGTEVGCDLCQDKKELFILKAAEEWYADSFKKIMAPHNKPSDIDKSAAIAVKAYLSNILPGTNSLETNGDVTTADMALTKLAADTLANRMKQLSSVIVIGHSQLSRETARPCAEQLRQDMPAIQYTAW